MFGSPNNRSELEIRDIPVKEAAADVKLGDADRQLQQNIGGVAAAAKGATAAAIDQLYTKAQVDALVRDAVASLESEIDNLRIEMGNKIAAAIEAAAPCTKSEVSVNAEGAQICTMKVDQVQSLRGDN